MARLRIFRGKELFGFAARWLWSVRTPGRSWFSVKFRCAGKVAVEVVGELLLALDV